jgi:CheY-like chemotaxis protein
MSKMDIGGPVKLVILGDEPVMLRYLERLTMDMDCDVGVCTSAEELLAAAALEKPDCVVADVDMRGRKSGLQACSLLRDAAPGCRFLLVSGDGGNIRGCQDAGFEAILEKPFTPDEFRALFSGLLEGRRKKS